MGLFCLLLPGQDSVTAVETSFFSLRNLPSDSFRGTSVYRFSSHLVGGILASSPA